jgi:hypothetical protein
LRSISKKKENKEPEIDEKKDDEHKKENAGEDEK